MMAAAISPRPARHNTHAALIVPHLRGRKYVLNNLLMLNPKKGGAITTDTTQWALSHLHLKFSFPASHSSENPIRARFNTATDNNRQTSSPKEIACNITLPTTRCSDPQHGKSYSDGTEDPLLHL